MRCILFRHANYCAHRRIFFQDSSKMCFFLCERSVGSLQHDNFIGWWSLMPVFVICQKIIDASGWEEVWRDGHDFLIRWNDTSCVTEEIFKEEITNMCLKSLTMARECLSLGSIPPVILLRQLFVAYCWRNQRDACVGKLMLVTFSLPTLNVFQPFGLMTFSVFEKKCEIAVKLPKGSQVWHITKRMEALERATDSSNNRSALKWAGLL
jgi:hypothetical protein